MRYRPQRVGDQIRAELADLIQHEVRDPRIGFVTVTEVRMSPDLHYARVYVSILGDDEQKSESLDVLERARGFLRAQIGDRVELRVVPELRFVLDDTLDRSERIEELLEESGDLDDEAPAEQPGDPGDG